MCKYNVGDFVEGLVTGIENYGIFVKIDEDYVGLIHISEISNDFVKNVENFATVGEKINSRIIEVDDNSKQMKLSIKEEGSKPKGKRREMIVETGNGFKPLKDSLESWISKKYEDLNNK